MNSSDPRRAAYHILHQVEGGAYADLALDALLRGGDLTDSRDQRLCTELVYGVLRQRGRLDYALARFCSRPLAKLEPAVLHLLRLGAYQILCLDRIPAHAAVHATVELTRQLGLQRATGLVNGILRNLVRQLESLAWPELEQDPLAHLVHAQSLPRWLAERWLRRYGSDEAAALGRGMLDQAPTTLRVNTLKTTRETYLDALAEAGHEALPTHFAPDGVIIRQRADQPLPGDAEGLYQIQDEASQLIAHLLQPQPRETILDACAAPGGKTTHIAALAENGAQIQAIDLHPHRLKLLQSGARRLGCTGITARPWDLSRRPDFLSAESCDRVLVDAPCSGLGVLRRNPELRWRRRPDDLHRLARLQQALLANLATLVRPDGVLLYSVCTITPEETEQVVDAFLAAHPQFIREDLRDTAPAAWNVLFDETGALRTLPHRHAGMDGFYAVRMRRKENR